MNARLPISLLTATAMALCAVVPGAALAKPHHAQKHHAKHQHHHKRPHRHVGRGGFVNPYAGGGCTAWAWKNRQDLPHHLGNAKSWAANAAAAGFPVDGVPEVGAIAVYQPHVYGAFAPYGHVAFVTEVHGSTIRISEASYHGDWSDHGDNEIGYRNTGTNGVQFIHHKGWNPTPAHADPPPQQPAVTTLQPAVNPQPQT